VKDDVIIYLHMFFSGYKWTIYEKLKTVQSLSLSLNFIFFEECTEKTESFAEVYLKI